MTEKSKGCMIGCAVALGGVVCVGICFVLLLSLLVAAAGNMESLMDDMGSDMAESSRIPRKVWVRGDGGEDDPTVVLVPLRGVISGVSGASRARKGSSLAALEKIRAAIQDDDVDGICLQIDSPGGEVTASDVLADAIERFRKSRDDRFVLVHMGAICCSGGYYVAAGADYVMAHPTTMTGSIGVIMETLNAAPLAKRVGVDSVVIATGDNKALLDPFKPVSQEHVDIVRKVVSADYERFLSVVAKGRNLPLEDVRKIADGRILSAQEAKSLKLIDGIGYEEDAYRQMCRLAKSKAVRIYRYEDKKRLHDLLSESLLFQDIDGLAEVLGERLSEGAALRAKYQVR